MYISCLSVLIFGLCLSFLFLFVQHKATFLNSFKSRNTIFFHSVMKNTIYFIVWWKIPFISRCCVFNDSSKIGRSQLLYCSKCSFMLNKVTCLLVNDAKWWDIIFSAHFWIVANQELEFRKVDSLTLALKPLASLVGAGLTCPLFWILVLDWLQNKNEPQKRYLIIFHHSPVDKLPFNHNLHFCGRFFNRN